MWLYMAMLCYSGAAFRILGMLYILVLCYLSCDIGYCGSFIDVIFRNVLGLNLSFRAFGLRNLERVLRKMFWVGVEFSTCWTRRTRGGN